MMKVSTIPKGVSKSSETFTIQINLIKTIKMKEPQSSYQTFQQIVEQIFDKIQKERSRILHCRYLVVPVQPNQCNQS